MPTGNIIHSSSIMDQPPRIALLAGKSGEGINLYRAPSIWASITFNLNAGVDVVLVAATVGRANRIYRYILSAQEGTGVGPPVPPIFLRTQWGPGFGGAPVMTHRTWPYDPTSGVTRSHLYEVFEASPTGISYNANTGFYLYNLAATRCEGTLFVLWSTEGWGQAIGTGGHDGFDIP